MSTYKIIYTYIVIYLHVKNVILYIFYGEKLQAKEKGLQYKLGFRKVFLLLVKCLLRQNTSIKVNFHPLDFMHFNSWAKKFAKVYNATENIKNTLRFILLEELLQAIQTSLQCSQADGQVGYHLKILEVAALLRVTHTILLHRDLILSKNQVQS